jgi:hypothetical protein
LLGLVAELERRAGLDAVGVASRAAGASTGRAGAAAGVASVRPAAAARSERTRVDTSTPRASASASASARASFVMRTRRYSLRASPSTAGRPPGCFAALRFVVMLGTVGYETKTVK